jgi:hypothetical protein
MIPCQVKALFASDGQPRPQELTWEDETLSIIDTGRHWSDEAGQHILVHVSDGRVFELLYNGVAWSARLASQPPHFA